MVEAIKPEIQAMLDAIRRSALECANWTGAAELDARVMDAMAAVPRDRFMGQGLADTLFADPWANRPAPIGCGQTVSQPFIVALMSHFLKIEPGARVLEVGCGSGYQAAVLAELGARVLSLERIPALAKRAEKTLAETGYGDRVTVRVADGFEGAPDEAPFDGIIVTAAPERMPPALIGQVAPGGRLIAPRGRQHEAQMLVLIEKGADGRVLDERAVLPVAFVPMLPGLSEAP